MTARLDGNDHRWDVGTVKVKASPIPITYLIGTPNEQFTFTEIVVVAAEMVYMGLRFTEVSFSVRALLTQCRSNPGMRLLHAFTTNRVFAWFERMIFTTPYSHGECHVSIHGSPSVRLDIQGERVLSARMSSVERPVTRDDDECWEMPVFLPPRGVANGSRIFFGRIRGHTIVCPFVEGDLFALETSPGGGVLQPLADFGFRPQEWVVRADGIHGKSKIYLRTDIFTDDPTPTPRHCI